MDVDCWSSKNHSIRHFSTFHSARINSDNHLVLEEFEGDDDPRACFPCPFCYVDIEINMLCCHLQDEHCFDLKNAVCPLCAANLGKDATGHFVVQHANSLKRRRRSLRTGFWTTSSATLGKELSLFLGSSTTESTPESAPDPLLSPFVCSTTGADSKAVQPDENSEQSLVATDMTSTQQCEDVCEEDKEKRRQIAEFVQELVASTIFQ